MLDIQLLQQFPFFHDLTEEQMLALGETGEVITYNADTTLFLENDPAEHFFGLLEGEVELSLVFKDRILKADIEFEEAIRTHVEILEKPIVMEHVKPDQVFGWSALTENSKRTLSARTLNPCRLIALSSELMRIKFQADPQLGFTIMDRLSNLISSRLKSRTDKLIEAWGVAFGVDSM